MSDFDDMSFYTDYHIYDDVATDEDEDENNNECRPSELVLVSVDDYKPKRYNKRNKNE